MVSVSDFEAVRPRLVAKAFRLLVSVHDAEDAVQSAWLRAAAADVAPVRNPAAWLTTIVTRVCLDQLRTRHRRGEEPLLADAIPADQLAADELYLKRENVSRALMVVLEVLTPSQRVAYVLHDLFDVPFREVAEVLESTEATAKQHASRARRRITRTEPASTTTAADNEVVNAFLAAAAGGDMAAMLALMADDCVREVDASQSPTGTPTVVVGARAVAEETRLFANRIRSRAPMLVDGRAAHVIAPGGHLLAVIDIDVREGRVTRIDITPARAGTLFAQAVPLT